MEGLSHPLENAVKTPGFFLSRGSGRIEPAMADDIRSRLAIVRERIARAADRSGRNPEDITLIGVSKTFPAQAVAEAVNAGISDLGENRVQEAVGKVRAAAARPARWHLIGHLQSNKVRLAAETFDVIHTIDSVRLAERLDRAARETGRSLRVLVQVDLGHEQTKSGVTEDELGSLVDCFEATTNLELSGLMTLPPYFEMAEKTRPYFRRLAELLVALNEKRPASRKLEDLSMGMSHDFEVAIEEGATLVRIGTAIFGSRR